MRRGKLVRTDVETGQTTKHSAFELIVNELRLLPFWRKVLAEFLASFFYVLIMCESLVALRSNNKESEKWQMTNTRLNADLVYGSVTGLTAMALSWCFHDVSGGHLTPAITAAMLLTRKMALHTALCYIIAQCFAAIAACGVLYFIMESDHVGITVVHPHLGSSQALLVEFLISFIYVLSFHAATDKHRRSAHTTSFLLFGSAVIVAATFGAPFTGSSMNPARSLGPAVIENYWYRHWIYWAGPLLGGSMGGVLYDVLFSGNASCRRARAFVKETHYDPDYRYQDDDVATPSTPLLQEHRHVSLSTLQPHSTPSTVSLESQRMDSALAVANSNDGSHSLMEERVSAV